MNETARDPVAPAAPSATIDLLILVLAWAVAILLVDPRGDFPLNDDWSYGRTVERLVEEGRFRPIGWTAMTLFSQAVWGAIFTIPAGFSFTALRLSTLALSLIGAFAVYFVVRKAEPARGLALLAALTLAFNPIWLALSFTFMSDVPFGATAALATLFLLESLDPASTRAPWTLLAGGSLASAAVLCRQVGLVLPVAFALAVLVQEGWSARAMRRAGLVLALCVGPLIALGAFLHATGAQPSQMPALGSARLPSLALWDVPDRAATLLVYLGLFLLPVLLWLAPPRPSTAGRRLAYFLGVFFVVGVSARLLATGRTMPLMRFWTEANVLEPTGIGPTTLRDVFILKLPRLRPLPAWLWTAATAGGVLGGGLLLVHLGSLLGERGSPRAASAMPPRDGRALFCLAAAGLYALPLVVAPYTFDRYFLALVPLLVAALSTSRGIVAPSSPATRVSACVLAGLVAVGSVAMTRDYLEWNRVRWRLLRNLTDARRVPASRIDGGFEFNGLHLYRSGGPRAGTSKSWWWVEDDEYLVAFGDLPGYETLEAESYTRWLPPGVDRVHVLRRIARRDPGAGP